MVLTILTTKSGSTFLGSLSNAASSLAFTGPPNGHHFTNGINPGKLRTKSPAGLRYLSGHTSVQPVIPSNSFCHAITSGSHSLIPTELNISKSLLIPGVYLLEIDSTTSQKILCLSREASSSIFLASGEFNTSLLFISQPTKSHIIVWSLSTFQSKNMGKT